MPPAAGPSLPRAEPANRAQAEQQETERVAKEQARVSITTRTAHSKASIARGTGYDGEGAGARYHHNPHRSQCSSPSERYGL